MAQVFTVSIFGAFFDNTIVGGLTKRSACRFTRKTQYRNEQRDNNTFYNAPSFGRNKNYERSKSSYFQAIELSFEIENELKEMTDSFSIKVANKTIKIAEYCKNVHLQDIIEYERRRELHHNGRENRRWARMIKRINHNHDKYDALLS